MSYLFQYTNWFLSRTLMVKPVFYKKVLSNQIANVIFDNDLLLLVMY